MFILFSYLFNPYRANVDNMATSYHASKWRMGFNSAFKELKSSKELRNARFYGKKISA